MLIDCAINRELVPYSPNIVDVMQLEAGVSMARELGLMLGVISEDEHVQGRPMLSAAAISKDNLPGDGFFSLAKSLGKKIGKNKDRFWQAELKSLYDYWETDKQLTITDFFSTVIGIPLANQVWSWGVFDESNDRVFLKIHDRDLSSEWDEWVKIYDPNWNDSDGHAERLRHIEWIRSGAECFGVRRSSDSFDSKQFVRLGEVDNEGERVYAKILGLIAVDSVLRIKAKSMYPDFTEITSSNRSNTEKETMVSARIGQGEFRRKVLAMWDNRCAVTKVSVRQSIRASHIKPWRESSDEERLDPNNGLPLVATLDSLFDTNLISFDENGKILISHHLSKSDRSDLRLNEGMCLTKRLTKRQQEFLRQHAGKSD